MRKEGQVFKNNKIKIDSCPCYFALSYIPALNWHNTGRDKDIVFVCQITGKNYNRAASDGFFWNNYVPLECPVKKNDNNLLLEVELAKPKKPNKSYRRK